MITKEARRLLLSRAHAARHTERNTRYLTKRHEARSKAVAYELVARVVEDIERSLR